MTSTRRRKDLRDVHKLCALDRDGMQSMMTSRFVDGIPFFSSNVHIAGVGDVY